VEPLPTVGGSTVERHPSSGGKEALCASLLDLDCLQVLLAVFFKHQSLDQRAVPRPITAPAAAAIERRSAPIYAGSAAFADVAVISLDLPVEKWFSHAA
jgi:hypothetical protein